ncbi:MAG TPA: peptide deformylase [Candidatus Nitrosocosmicus sp.]|jgi:peptide deformylase|nr:peptide deformylase [Candidatus Nitrosocosmicus sp.]
MAVLNVRRYGDPILRQKAQPVEAITPEIRKTLTDMLETMYYQVGIGLAAPQVGVSLRIILVDDGPRGPRALLNPAIVDQRGSVRGEEGCLSIPGFFGEVERSEWVRVEAMDAEGRPLSFEAKGLQARVIQHELDHLDGVLFIDRLPPVTRDRMKKKIQKDGLPEDAPHHAFAL